MSFLVVKESKEKIVIGLYDNWQYFNEGNSQTPTIDNASGYIKNVVALSPCL